MFQNKLWLSNGYYHDNTVSRDLWNSEDGVRWTRVNAATPYDPYTELVVFREQLWAVKGSVWKSSNGVQWEPVCAATPFGKRGYSEAVVFQDRIWHLGTAASVWNTENGADWACVNDSAPFGARYAAGIAVFQGKLWLMGGSMNQRNEPPEKIYPEMTTYNDVWCSEDGVTWTRVLEHAPWSPRMWFPVVEFGGQLWLMGGFDNRNKQNLNDLWQSTNGVVWNPGVPPAAPFSPRHEPTVYVFRDTLWMVAGNMWPVLNDVWRIEPPRAASP